jgi:hypothetical protein
VSDNDVSNIKQGSGFKGSGFRGSKDLKDGVGYQVSEDRGHRI